MTYSADDEEHMLNAIF